MRKLVYTARQAIGAMPNGTRVEKQNSKPGEAHPDGSLGTIIGSIGPLEVPEDPSRYGYFVEWDAHPGIPIFTGEVRLKPVKAQ